MNSVERHVVRATWTALADGTATVAAYFYERLFEIDPSLRLLYLGADLAAHGRALTHAVSVAVANLERLEGLAIDLGVGESLGAVGQALLAAIERALGPINWTPRVRLAWARCCALLTASQQRPATIVTARVA